MKIVKKNNFFSMFVDSMIYFIDPVYNILLTFSSQTELDFFIIILTSLSGVNINYNVMLSDLSIRVDLLQNVTPLRFFYACYSALAKEVPLRNRPNLTFVFPANTVVSTKYDKAYCTGFLTPEVKKLTGFGETKHIWSNERGTNERYSVFLLKSEKVMWKNAKKN